MKIFDLSCEECGSHYKVAESEIHAGEPGELECEVCGSLIAQWDAPRLRVSRLVTSAETTSALLTTAPLPLI